MSNRLPKDISIIPTYSEDGSLITIIIDKLSGEAITTDDLQMVLESYAGMIKASKGSKEGLN